ncbi:39S ribosomal protein L17, mitochondrial isoform X2 [Bombina bombina]|uniref:39S ribosomal protein L17, mitochondrial isoform X2 n=1 Tax=Bombina bombina TaxID=8345 RepID=UPI00235AF8A5|nr:39S ribosomal protein L17, mitochondrial isoform X2 [Bombina bombina]
MRLFPALLISHGRVSRRLGLGPRSRLDMMRNLVTALVRHERIETTWVRADEMRFYAEKEKDLIHKLFKMLAPRFESHSSNYTNMYQIPTRQNLDRAKMAVIEYKGNPYPPLITPKRDNDKTLLNQLIKGYRLEKARATA